MDEHGGEVPRHGGAAELLLRPLHPHHRPRPPALDAGAVAADGGRRRHLPVEVRRLVLGPGRGLLRRERADDGSRTARGSRRRARRSNGSRRRAISSASRPTRIGCSRITTSNPTSSARRRGATRSSASSAGGLQDLSISRTTFDWGLPGPGRPEARDVRVGRRAQQLRDRLPAFRTSERRAGATGRPTCTSSARTSSASTRSTGRPS